MGGVGEKWGKRGGFLGHPEESIYIVYQVSSVKQCFVLLLSYMVHCWAMFLPKCVRVSSVLVLVIKFMVRLSPPLTVSTSSMLCICQLFLVQALTSQWQAAVQVYLNLFILFINGCFHFLFNIYPCFVALALRINCLIYGSAPPLSFQFIFCYHDQHIPLTYLPPYA